MATTAEAVRNGIEAAIRAIVPKKNPSTRYKLVGARDGDIAGNALPGGNERDFEVWIGPDWEHGDLQHQTEFGVIQKFLINVGYPRTSDWRAQDAQIREDAADIKRALDNPVNWVSDTIHQVLLRAERQELAGPAGSKWVLTLIVKTEFLESYT